MPGVVVTAIHQATQVTRTVVTDVTGVFRFNALPIGEYEFHAEMAGFQMVTVTGYRLGVGDSATLDILMKVATVEETITVTAKAPVVETTKSDLAGRIDQLQVEEVPLSGRDWITLADLAPGIKSAGSTGAPSAGVGDGRNTAVLLDGASVQNRSTKASIDVQVSKDAIGEFEVITNRFDAQMGHAGTAVVNAVTKAGTDKFSGSGFAYFRDDSLMAEDFFTGTKEPYSNRQYGGTIGGPIIPGKTHFFFSYERREEPKTVSSNTGVASLDEPVDAGDRQNLYFIRVEHSLTEANRLSGRINIFDKLQENVGVGGTVTPSNSTKYDWLIKRYQLSLDSVIAGKWVNQVGFTYLDTFRKFDPMGNGPGHIFPSLNLGGRYNVGHEIPSFYFIRDDVSVFFEKGGQHNLKFGGEYEHGDVQGFFAASANGQFYYEQDPPNVATCCPGYDQNQWDFSQWPAPVRFTQALGDYSISAPNDIFGFYIQDDWTINERLTLNLGMRWDAEFGSLAHDFTGLVEMDHGNDLNNFQPRVGFAWDVLGEGKTVIRGGGGQYVDQVFLNVTFNVLRSNTGKQVTVTTYNPDADPNFINDPLDGRGFDDFIGGKGAANVAQFPEGRIEQPKIWSYSIGVAHELTPDLGFSADYVAQRSDTMIRSFDSNLFCCLPDGNALPVRSGFYPELGGQVEGAGRPDPRFNRIQNYSTIGKSRYHGLQVAVNKRMSNNYLVGVTYLLSKTEDDHSGAFSYPNNMFDLDDEYGTSSRDQRHRFVANWVAQLPYEFSFSGVLFMASGQALGISSGIDINGDGYSGGDRPTCGLDSRFDAACSFLGIQDGQRIPRNPFYSDPIYRLDLRLTRRFSVSGVNIDPIFEIFNVFNRENYDPGRYNRSLTSSQFGQPGRSDGLPYLPRQIQLAVRVTF
jgi:hypothetical protein